MSRCDGVLNRNDFTANSFHFHSFTFTFTFTLRSSTEKLYELNPD